MGFDFVNAGDAAMIRLQDCREGDFQNSPEAIAWVNELGVSISKLFEAGSIVKIGAYARPCSTNMMIDISSNTNPSIGLAITITFTGNEILLPKFDGGQTDIWLPGLIDAFYIANVVSKGNTVVFEV